jgi:hypothetical protein
MLLPKPNIVEFSQIVAKVCRHLSRKQEKCWGAAQQSSRHRNNAVNMGALAVAAAALLEAAYLALA